MSESSKSIFEVEEHEKEFHKICSKLKVHPFESPWKLQLSEEADYFYTKEMREFSIPGWIEADNQKNTISHTSIEQTPKLCEAQLFELQESLLAAQKNSEEKEVRGIEIFNTISPHQVEELSHALKEIFSNDETLTVFLKAILNVQRPFSVTVAYALVSHILYPQVFEKQRNSRNLLSTVLSFCEVYPKPMIDEALKSCLKCESLDALQLETLLKLVKNIISDDYVPYVIEIVVKEAMVTENAFVILQTLIERKIYIENDVHEMMATKLKSWSQTNNNNMKFIKLVISALTVYGSELSEQQITIYSDIIKNNQTIMKRAAGNILKKLT